MNCNRSLPLTLALSPKGRGNNFLPLRGRIEVGGLTAYNEFLIMNDTHQFIIRYFPCRDVLYNEYVIRPPTRTVKTGTILL